MKKSVYFFLAVLFLQSTWAQDVQFEQVFPPPPAPQIKANFIPVSAGDSAFADIDGDNDLDVLIMGESGYDSNDAALYVNDGNGNYTQVENTPFVGLSYGSVDFADVDGDNDLDVLITGKTSDDTRISALYLNDGTGNFTETTDTPFVGVDHSSAVFADVDGDNDPDVLITGYTDESSTSTKLYINDGSGNFTEDTDASFIAVNNSSVAFTDVDGDNDLDVFILGEALDDNSIYYSSAILYINDGSGNFTEATDTPFIATIYGSMAFADVDGDNDPDVLITGYLDKEYVSKLYLNDGSGNFTEDTDFSIIGASYSSLDFADVDGDNDLDLVIAGISDGDIETSKLYLNDGTGNFTENTNVSFIGVMNSSVAFADVDNDNDMDVLITGHSAEGDYISKLYINDGTGNYAEAIDTIFTKVYKSSVAFADVDNDNDQDVLIAGSYTCKLYFNDGTGNFTEVTDTPFPGLFSASVAFADIDGDNDQDLLITGESDNGYTTKLYLNDGTGNFTEVDTPFPDVMSGSVVFADVDNDNDLDVFIAGRSDDSQEANLYFNDGTGNFAAPLVSNFPGISGCSVAFADIDGDNDLDLFMTGWNDEERDGISKLYTNDGSGNFTEVTDNPLPKATGSTINFADIDGDNDQDVLITGWYERDVRITKLYTNDGTGTFTEVTDTPFIPVNSGSVAFSDVDNDGDQDVFIAGNYSGDFESADTISILYLNDGTGNFTELTGTPFTSVMSGSVAFTDIDSDNDPDLLITGMNSEEGKITYLYRNLVAQLDVTENQMISNLKLYPNPGINVFTIDSANQPVEDIKIYNLQGQEMPFVFDSQQQQLYVNYPKGIYLVKLKILNTENTLKMIVQ